VCCGRWKIYHFVNIGIWQNRGYNTVVIMNRYSVHPYAERSPLTITAATAELYRYALATLWSSQMPLSCLWLCVAVISFHLYSPRTPPVSIKSTYMVLTCRTVCHRRNHGCMIGVPVPRLSMLIQLTLVLISVALIFSYFKLAHFYNFQIGVIEPYSDHAMLFLYQTIHF